MSAEEILNTIEEALSRMPPERCVGLFNAVSNYSGALSAIVLTNRVPTELPSEEYHGARLLEARARLLPLIAELLAE